LRKSAIALAGACSSICVPSSGVKNLLATRITKAGYAIDDSTPNRQYWDLWLKIIRKTNWSSISGS
jgi:hypothetical protein